LNVAESRGRVAPVAVVIGVGQALVARKYDALFLPLNRTAQSGGVMRECAVQSSNRVGDEIVDLYAEVPVLLPDFVWWDGGDAGIELVNQRIVAVPSLLLPFDCRIRECSDMMPQSKDVTMKILPLILIATALCVPGVAKTRHSANHKKISGSGCIEKGVKNSCHVIIDSQTGETYNLKFSNDGPRPGTAIRFTGMVHRSENACVQGKPVSVSKWKKEKGIKCPPQLDLEAMR
jgi:hypothetical protein